MRYLQFMPAAASLAGRLSSKSNVNVVLSRLPAILPESAPPGFTSPVIFSTLKSLGACTTRWMPAIGDLAWLVFRSIDLTAAAEAVSLPPPGESMMIAIVRCLPPFVPSAYDDVRKLSASCGVMASSLNQIATLRESPYSDATQWVAVNFSPPIDPVAAHR